MDSIANLINKRRLEKAVSERGELLKFFRDKLVDKKGKPYSYGRLAGAVSFLSVSDLYFLRSICIDGENRGQPFGKIFWGSIKYKDKSTLK